MCSSLVFCLLSLVSRLSRRPSSVVSSDSFFRLLRLDRASSPFGLAAAGIGLGVDSPECHFAMSSLLLLCKRIEETPCFLPDLTVICRHISEAYAIDQRCIKMVYQFCIICWHILSYPLISPPNCIFIFIFCTFFFFYFNSHRQRSFESA